MANNAEQRLQHNLTVGIHAAWHGMYPSPSTLVEFIEMYLALGATKIIAYNVSSTANLTHVIEYYTGKGVLDLHQWDLPPDTSTAHFAQAATIGDCIYRYMYQTKYLALVNLDEFFIPLRNESLLDVLSWVNNSNAGALQFGNVFYPLNNNRSNLVKQNVTLRKLNSSILSYTYKELHPCCFFGRRKVIFMPSLVVRAYIHNVIEQIPGTEIYTIPEGVAQMHHYRNWKEKDVQFIEDEHVYLLVDRIAKRLKKARSEIGEKHSK